MAANCEAIFFERVHNEAPGLAGTVRHIYDWAQSACWTTWGQGGSYPMLHGADKRAGIKFFHLGFDYIDIKFRNLTSKAPFRAPHWQEDLLSRLNQLPGVGYDRASLTKTKSPFSLQPMAAAEDAQRVVEVLAWIGEQLADPKP
jgi:hypothetical protein